MNSKFEFHIQVYFNRLLFRAGSQKILAEYRDVSYQPIPTHAQPPHQHPGSGWYTSYNQWIYIETSLSPKVQFALGLTVGEFHVVFTCYKLYFFTEMFSPNYSQLLNCKEMSSGLGLTLWLQFAHPWYTLMMTGLATKLRIPLEK